MNGARNKNNYYIVEILMPMIKALQILKGGLTYLFFRANEKAGLRYPRWHLWNPGKFVSSLGFI